MKNLKSFIQNSIYLINISNSNQKVLLNSKLGERLEIDLSAIRRELGHDDFKTFEKKNIKNAIFEYDPFSTRVFWEDEYGILHFNNYHPPEWKKKNYYLGEVFPQAPKKPPQIYDDFFHHLTGGDQESINYLYDWMSNMLKEKNLTYLTIIGNQGIGKGTFGEILKKLVGKSNYKETSDTCLKKEFNAHLKDKHLIYIDEIAIKQKNALDRLKSFCNPEMEFEGKGVDAVTIQNHASLYLSSNHDNAISIEANDRRFSIINVTGTPLRSHLFNERREELFDERNITALALYLMLEHKLSHSMISPFKCERYEEILEASLTEWERDILEKVIPENKGKIFDFKEFKAIVEITSNLQRAPGRDKVKSFCSKYPELIKFKESSGERTIEILTGPEV